MKSIHKRLYSALPRAGSATRASLCTNAIERPPPPLPPRKSKQPHVALTPSHPQAPSAVLPPCAPWPLLDAHHHLALHRPLRPPHTHYRLDVGAYGIPKHRPHAAVNAPDALHLAVQVGEDAYFVRGNALGIADGVGGWARHAPPTQPSASALFARRLMHYTASEFSADDPDRSPDMLAILERAYDRTVGAHTTPAGTPLHAGSSTALIACLSDSLHPAVHLAHVGDSMGMVVRDSEIVWRSDEMWWAWNTPVQLSPPPTPSPRSTARIFSVPVLPDDILILASDGLSDNLWDEDVLDEVARFRRTWAHLSSDLRRGPMAHMLSEALCSRARSVSERKPKPPESDLSDTPFARRAREVGKPFSGGKRDDISVLVAIVAPASR